MKKKAKSKKKAKRKLTHWTFFTLSAFILAVILWINWSDIKKLIQSAQKTPSPQRLAEPSQEEILEQERKDLENILKQR